MKVLVTGGAGYIGSHIALCLLDRGYKVVILDNLTTGIASNIPKGAAFYQADIGDAAALRGILRDEKPTSVIHCAGATVVPESMLDPVKYYQANVSTATAFLNETVLAGVQNWLFSSTAAVYGNPKTDKVAEDHSFAPLSPYGHSKLMFEQILVDVCSVHNVCHAALRYFNVAGADPQGRSGQSTPNATHLLKVAAKVAVSNAGVFEVFGTDYNTPDGSCVRDFIHVSDLAEVHVETLEHMTKHRTPLTMNCGYSKGYSVLEVLAEVQRQSHDFEVVYSTRRDGDIGSIVANSDVLTKTLNWTPKHNSLEVIVRDALLWERNILANSA
ncbi:UDP-glucose 4-epimerase GalE [Algirhabdus cladophorae]|uniref:UDP-glucose 4-epimerase GalE n=1 Tax=Algirhabdus cladophorae TaxID=3377108 RepID=UPI003B846719